MDDVDVKTKCAASTVLVAVGMEVPTATDKTGLLEGQTSLFCAVESRKTKTKKNW